MADGAQAVVDRYEDQKRARNALGPGATEPVLTPRRGGPLEIGYPEDPKAAAAAGAEGEQALNQPAEVAR
jgi:hypothetical protein